MIHPHHPERSRRVEATTRGAPAKGVDAEHRKAFNPDPIKPIEDPIP